MITIKSNNYTKEEREYIPKLFNNIEYSICSQCDNSLSCSEFANKSCKYRHILYDIENVKLSYPTQASAKLVTANKK